MEVRLSLALDTIEILRGTYRYSEEEFFHPELKGLQMDELLKGGFYSDFFFGIEFNSPIEEVEKAYKRLSMKYHPDRGGDAEIMALINTLKEHYTLVDKHNQFLSKKAERAQRFADYVNVQVPT